MPRPAIRVPPGTVAPDFSLPSASGGVVALADYRDRALVVLVFLRSFR
jgi:peroxiredoxin